MNLSIAQNRYVSSCTPQSQTNPDAHLKSAQSRAVESALTERAGGGNVPLYTRVSRMNAGLPWCGFFAAYNLDVAARANGGRFHGIDHLHSMQKARSYFQYRNFTDNSPAENARLDKLRAQHQAEGSTRQWMTFKQYTPDNLPIRPGDVVLFNFNGGHVGMVVSYDPVTKKLKTIEGNAGRNGGILEREYDLSKPEVRALIEGFGRPAAGDMR